jgi:alpha-ketoglutarate-dependent taurine dioxygenase
MTDVLSVEDLEPLDGHRRLLQVDAADPGAAERWLAENAAAVDRLVAANGAVLLRGLGVHDEAMLGRLLAQLFGEDLLDYIYRSTPRTRLQSKVYTASEYHPGETILLHNENSYTNRWPLRIAFCCVRVPAEGGQTPIADSREVLRRMPGDIVERFERKGLMYVRNYGSIDLPWSEVFQTLERAEVEAYCAANDIEWEWLPGNALRTRQYTPGLHCHPQSGTPVWFNAAHMFHVSSLKPDVQRAMLSLVGEESLPRNVYFGDGSRIDFEIFERIRAVYREHKQVFDWQSGDLLLLDNMLYAHGREPYVGERRVLVGMARAAQLQPAQARPELVAAV